MEIQSLELFVDVVKLGSFAAVARQRHIDPSSVSRSVHALEEELKFRLLQRTTRQVTLTEAGAIYFDRVRHLVADLNHAKQLASDTVDKPYGVLRVTASNSFGLRQIVPLLPEFKRKNPDLVVDLFLTDSVVDLLAERVDLAIRMGVLLDSAMVAQRLKRTKYVVCASPHYLRAFGHPASPSEITEHKCLVFPLPGFRSRWLFKDDAGEVSEVMVNGDVLISNGLALQQCAVEGMGLALLADWQVQDDIERGTLVNVFPRHDVTATTFDTAVWFVYPSRSFVPLKVRAFIEHVTAAMAT